MTFRSKTQRASKSWEFLVTSFPLIREERSTSRTLQAHFLLYVFAQDGVTCLDLDEIWAHLPWDQRIPMWNKQNQNSASEGAGKSLEESTSVSYAHRTTFLGLSVYVCLPRTAISFARGDGTQAPSLPSLTPPAEVGIFFQVGTDTWPHNYLCNWLFRSTHWSCSSRSGTFLSVVEPLSPALCPAHSRPLMSV